MNLTKSRNVFFVSAFSFAVAAIVQLILDFASPIPVEVVGQYRASWLVQAAGLTLFVLTLIGLVAFLWGLIASFFRNQQEE